MSKKIFLALSMIILVSLMVVPVALAQASQPTTGARVVRRGVGQVVEVGENEFTLKSRDGNEHSIRVAQNTRFRFLNGDLGSFEDLKAGQRVAVVAIHQVDNTWLADRVVFLPEGFDPALRLGVRTRGRIQAVDLATSTFMLKTRSGEQKTFQVGQETHFIGSVNSLSELQEGMLAAVGGKQQEDGSLLAIVVWARFQREKHVGQMIAVDPAAGTFTLRTALTRQDLIFAVDQETRFRSRNGQVKSLQDLQPGILAVVVADNVGETFPLAKWVAAGERGDLPRFDLRVAGRVEAVGTSSFVLRARNGQQYDFSVGEQTRFRSRGGLVQVLQDLKPGMLALVGARQTPGGEYQASLVIAGRPPRP